MESLRLELFKHETDYFLPLSSKIVLNFGKKVMQLRQFWFRDNRNAATRKKI